MRTIALIALAAALAALAGCKDKSETSGSAEAAETVGATGAAGAVAVVDLDRAANELGVNKKYQEYLTAATAQARAKLNDALVPMQQELEKRRKKLNDAIKELPEADRDNPEVLKKNVKVQAAYRDVVEQDTLTRNEASRINQALNSYDQQLKEAFKADVQPAITTISQKNSVRVVVEKKLTLYAMPQVDLTGELIDYLNAHPIKPLKAPPTTW